MSTPETVGQSIDVELDGIIAELDAADDELPEDAIHAARRHRDAIVPRLIESIRQATESARSGVIPEGNAYFFSLYLLTEFRAQEALPAIVEAISLPGELSMEILGDAITESLPRILGTLAPEDLDIRDNLIRNSGLNEYVRWSAAQSYVNLARDGVIERAVAAARLHTHLREAIHNEDRDIVGPLICILSDLRANEAYEDIVTALKLGLVDPLYTNLKYVDECFSTPEYESEDEYDNCQPTHIDDVIVELSSWAAFEPNGGEAHDDDVDDDYRDDPELEHQVDVFRRLLRQMDDESYFWEDEAEPDVVAPPDAPIVGSRRVGRNEPCICGSGKKYKRCCGKP